MSFGLTKIAKNHGFDEAYMMPGIFVSQASDFGLYNLEQIMPEAKSVLLLIKKHNPFEDFPIDTMSVHSHYPEYNKAYMMHNSLVEKLISIGIKAKSANGLPLKTYAIAAGMIRLKNSLVYQEGFGSYFVLQAVAVDAECEFLAREETDICGSCTKCIEACPMGAIEKNGKMNPSKCIRDHVPVGKFVSENIRIAAKTGFIGCGICQAVCPLNNDIKSIAPPLDICSALNITKMLDLNRNSGQIKQLQQIIGKNEARPGRTIATACMIAGNSKDEKYLPYLETILTQYINPLARGYAAWAFGMLGGRREALEAALAKEHNPQVKAEIVSALIDK